MAAPHMNLVCHHLARLCPHTALVVSLSGCLPIPWTAYNQPAINGQLLFAGRPLAGHTVTLAAPDTSGSCRVALATAVTDSGGQFTLPAQTHRYKFILLLPMDVWQGWSLCAAIEGRTVGLTQQGGVRM